MENNEQDVQSHPIPSLLGSIVRMRKKSFFKRTGKS